MMVGVVIMMIGRNGANIIGATAMMMGVGIPIGTRRAILFLNPSMLKVTIIHLSQYIMCHLRRRAWCIMKRSQSLAFSLAAKF